MNNCPQCGAEMTVKQRVCPQRCGYMFYFEHESMPIAATIEVLRFAWRQQRTELIAVLCAIVAGACLL
jgi:uncharacterized membrane protein YwaF